MLPTNNSYALSKHLEISDTARNQLMPPKLCVPSRQELAPLLEYAKPLSVVILFRSLGAKGAF